MDVILLCFISGDLFIYDFINCTMDELKMLKSINGLKQDNEFLSMDEKESFKYILNKISKLDPKPNFGYYDITNAQLMFRVEY